MSILPVTGVTISTAVQGLRRKITKQVLLPLKFQDYDAPGIFLVVSHLATTMIGDDLLTRHGVVINYLSYEIEIPRWKVNSKFPEDRGPLPLLQLTHLEIHYTPEAVIPTFLEYCVSSITMLQSYIKFPNFRYNV